ncbi:MAG: membrane-bound lytic murein transglycosylase MltF [Magnetococcales bacterium]|nr:membrane-bound lytic murein transglycosylase MltF [Magnetococcales bacterium]
MMAALGLSVWLSGCNLDREQPYLDRIREQGRITILTRNAPTTYFEGRDGKAGFEYELASRFAEYLGVRPQFVVLNSAHEVLEALIQGRGDLAAAGLVRPEAGSRFFLHGPVYQEVEPQVVCRRNGKKPGDARELSKVKLAVAAGTSHDQRLQALRKETPQLTWERERGGSTEQILEKVWRGEVDCTVADSNVVAINRRYYPGLMVRFSLGKPRPLAWFFPRRAGELRQEADRWFKGVKARGELDQLLERYFGMVETDEAEGDAFIDHQMFHQRVEELLPRFKPFFEAASRRFDVPWQLLAAVAYQESHWDPQAISGAGVRGIMMLTETTAQRLGVKNRLDPLQSILGGAWYLAFLRQSLPAEIVEPDRTWAALAAYNIGLGHLLDARELARRQGRNPALWHDLRKVLPLLAQRSHYESLRFGYARGGEPVIFVRRVRHYFDILQNWDKITASRQKAANLAAWEEDPSSSPQGEARPPGGGSEESGKRSAFEAERRKEHHQAARLAVLAEERMEACAVSADEGAWQTAGLNPESLRAGLACVARLENSLNLPKPSHVAAVPLSPSWIVPQAPILIPKLNSALLGLEGEAFDPSLAESEADESAIPGDDVAAAETSTLPPLD